MNSYYIFASFPDYYNLMNKSWFEECRLFCDERGRDFSISSIYIMPLNRYIEMGDHLLYGARRLVGYDGAAYGCVTFFSTHYRIDSSIYEY